MKFKRSKLLKLFLICLTINSVLSTISYAANFKLPEATSEFYVLDQENVLSESTKNHIINTNKELYEKTNAQVVVAVVSSLEDRPKEDFGLELFRKWGIGGKKENNGLLFLVAPNERETTIQVGYGLEGAITDGKAGEILDTYVIPYFSEDDYDSGILNGFNAIVQRVTEEYEIEIQGIEVDDVYQNTQTGPSPFTILLIVALFAIDFIFFKGFFTFAILQMIGRGGGGRGGGGFGGGSSGGGGSAGGGGAGRSF